MKHRFNVLIVLLMAFALVPAQAQDSGDAYLIRDGDIWAWNSNAPEQLTEWGFNGNPILSPDGSQIAYASVASEAVEVGGDPTQEQSHLVYMGTPVNNIWVMDTATRDFERIADQNGIFPVIRSTPAWSPTGDEIAWIEYTGNAENYRDRSRLKVYNLDAGTTRDLAYVNLGFQDGGLFLPTLQWGPAGITYDIFTFVETGGAQIQLHLVNPANNNISQFVLYASGDNPFAPGDRTPEDYVWVEHNARAMIAVLYNDGTWNLLDPSNGSVVALPQAPSLILRNGINARLTPSYSAGLGPNILWTATAPNGNTQDLGILTEGLTLQAPALSPSGNVVMVLSATGNGFEYQRIDGTDESGIALPFTGERQYTNHLPQTPVWSPVRWVTNGTVGAPVPTPSNPQPPVGSTACDLPVPFAIGDFVTVQAGEPNNMRNSPSLGGSYYASLYPGDLVSVTEGPICADGYRWWNVAGGGGFSGWTVDGAADGSQAWLLRIPQSPFLNDCPLMPRLQGGQTATVLPGEPNALRNGPGTNGTQVIGSIPASGQFTVLGSSLCSMDGRRWYPVSYNGQNGWTAEGENNTYWIAPTN